MKREEYLLRNGSQLDSQEWSYSDRKVSQSFS